MMIMSFFETVDVLPYVQSADLLVNGNDVVLTEDEQAQLRQQVIDLFEDSHTMPAFGVMFDEQFHEVVKDGTFVSLKFGRIMEVNELSFDELVFQVSPDFYGFNLFRGMHGIFEGRCIYIDLNGKTMQEFSDFINTLPAVKDALSNAENEQFTLNNEQLRMDDNEEESETQQLENAETEIEE